MHRRLFNLAAGTSPLTYLEENHVGGGQVVSGIGFWVWRWHYNHATAPCDYFLLTADDSVVQFFASLLPILWLVVIPVGRLLLLFAEAWQRRHRVRRGFCVNCGYNLTGNTSGVCPECGTPVAGKAGVKG